MAHFPRARRHRWFKESANYLEQFREEDGTFLFPASFLRETSPSYWVGGGRIGIEEGRRTAGVRRIESAFWMLKLRRLAGR